MTIAQSTYIQAYQLRAGGTRARLAILRMIAADSARNANPSTRLQPGDWRGARHWTLTGYAAAFATLSPGLNDGRPVWYSHAGPEFRDERFAHECDGGPDHTGWHTQADGTTCRDGTGLARGIVARLPHGRFIAGYWWGDNGERVYFPDVYDDESDAAQAADSHAETFADSAREDSERFDAMQDAETAVSDAIEALRDTWALRHTGRRDNDDVRAAIEALRDARDALTEKTRAYERG